MIRRALQFRIYIGLACLLLAGCATNSLRELTASDALQVSRNTSDQDVRLQANVYVKDETELWVSGSAQTINGTFLQAGHVHVRLWNSRRELLADQRLTLLHNAGVARSQKGSKKLFGGVIAALPPAQSSLDIQYHTVND